MANKQFFSILCSLGFFMFVGSCSGADQRSSNVHDDHALHSDTPAVHGMLLFGTKNIWLSHLPMFHKPHDYQVIMSVTLKKNGDDLHATYLADREQSKALYYSFVPKRFSMTHLVNGTLTSIEGTLVRGHFERGGITIETGVTAQIKTMPVAVQFQVDAVKPDKASYYVIGNSDETWLAHKIVAKPEEFDQIIGAEVSEDFWTANGSGAVLSTELANVSDLRLTEGTTVSAKSEAGSVTEIKVGKEIYQETGDLL